MSDTAFATLDFLPHRIDPTGVHAKRFFPNGYGASVVRSEHSWGGEDGLYEMAVLRGNKDDWALTYETPITDDVLGWLTPADVEAALAKIAALPPAEESAAP